LSSQAFSLSDGRKLGYIAIGEGVPVIYFHGTASSRLEVLLLKKLAETAHLQLIGVDRPGYGLSTYTPRKRLQDINGDINSLVNHLGLDTFAVLGWSGGGAFSLAYLSFFPKRITSAVIVGSPVLPFDVSTAHNTPLARYLMKIPFAGQIAMRQLSRQLLKADGDISVFLASKQGKQLLHGCSKGDLAFFCNSVWMSLMYNSMVEAFRQSDVGVKAVVEEHQIFMKPWNLSFGGITDDQLHIWHGAEDKTCRVSNAYALSRAVPSAKLEIFMDSGHCVMFENLEKLGKIYS
jgi:pimeloyl-ACP methyl ester carboxylesterase